ncbi:multidrug effflux MFS transporter [Providencia rettgeri]|uniref:multidrug effflux MFS transporter n=1 Tax=Providencia TaxID=586 RepID=UPI001CFE61BB|nr:MULTISPECIES: multidrug effflux MFS transporter [Providencia]EIU7555910.1 multidrug effflux MFS transporter [Providencia rettgeri]MCB4840148.1 multidrug effflux MFS transporter [Providencia rettgeri]MCG5276023.1 multidrug effflux MFS transporter [Providencia rettgeri]MCG9506719.1 multidrug effflux MFS transporter [Providencia rettgeri]HEM6922279.1 multidrug effflux MFS transporter [Providencia rettgeri]
MKHPLSLWLAVALMMFPQIVETIYSPALTNIASAFNVDAEQASQTLSFYFFAFALGVVFWGRMCDTLGRRPTILAGLLIYGIASICALFITHFYLLLLMRMLAAFGAAVGSIGTQTAMRDSYQGHELAKVFSIMGIALAISPALGMLFGAGLVSFGGYIAVFTGLAFLAVVLFIWSTCRLPETRPENVIKVPFMATFLRMITDKEIVRNVILIAFFNINLFSYYQLAPFSFERLMLTQQQFGLTGILLALGVGLGSIINRHLLAKKQTSEQLVKLSSIISLISGCLVFALMDSIWFILPVIGVVIGYGIAIPNILAHALNRYSDRKGTAGAILGLFYYIGLAIGLMVAGWSQHLGLVLTISGLVLVLSSLRYRIYTS